MKTKRLVKKGFAAFTVIIITLSVNLIPEYSINRHIDTNLSY
jgi:hypothetical protein